MKYEDNLWGSLIRLYLRKIAFIPSIEYFYRKNPTSTVHSKNLSFIRDRIFIENTLLNLAKERGFFEPYYSAWEYIYITRYAFNTCTMSIWACSGIDFELVNKVLNDLKTEFPSWRRNKYWKYHRKASSPKYKILLYLFNLSPKFLLRVFDLYRKLKRKLLHFLHMN